MEENMAEDAEVGCARPTGGPVGRNITETFRQVQAFQLIRETKGAEATPFGWRPGKTTLKSGIDLVGKVWKVWKPSEAFD